MGSGLSLSSSWRLLAARQPRIARPPSPPQSKNRAIIVIRRSLETHDGTDDQPETLPRDSCWREAQKVGGADRGDHGSARRNDLQERRRVFGAFGEVGTT